MEQEEFIQKIQQHGSTLEELEDDQDIENGYVLVCVDGYPLGWAKNNRGVLKNKYLSGWRMMS